MKNKRGAEIMAATGTIILVLLLVAALIWGFYTVFKKFSSQTTSDNVAEIVSGCQVACVTQSTFDYCTKDRTLVDADPATEDITASCNVLSKEPNTKYGIASCSSITCP